MIYIIYAEFQKFRCEAFIQDDDAFQDELMSKEKRTQNMSCRLGEQTKATSQDSLALSHADQLSSFRNYDFFGILNEMFL